MSRILLWTESFEEEKQTVKQKGNAPLPVVFHEPPVQEVDPSRIPPRSILTIRTHSRLNKELLGRLDCVITRSTGYDHLQSISPGIPVGYLPDYATEAVADHNLAVTLSLLRKLPRAEEASRSFNRNGLMGEELRSQTVGVVGVGRIGKATAERFRGLKVPVLGHDVDPDPDWAREQGVQYCGLEELMNRSTVVVLCLPLNESSRMMITPQLLGLLPGGSLLVNCGRGEVVSSRDLLEALQHGPLAGAALDVYNREGDVRSMLQEPDFRESPEEELEAVREFIQDPRVITTPHNAFNSREALDRKVHRTLENVRHFVEHGDVLNPVPY